MQEKTIRSARDTSEEEQKNKTGREAKEGRKERERETWAMRGWHGDFGHAFGARREVTQREEASTLRM